MVQLSLFQNAVLNTATVVILRSDEWRVKADNNAAEECDKVSCVDGGDYEGRYV
jgi:hypothetical protein